ncbi:phage holin family protein [Cupriavidus oxalaticus]|uniref:Holin n=1 Tax=Cupriavidus oxalaticus TaxID=96344 RepID=A0A4P7LK13_9BURK|nr:phage holin family protein [Cupriavidus oxalaticus]QBY56165.1 holin [Cupriavidus oxalaticus]
MQDHERNLYMLLVMGALIGLGKLLVSDDPITLRLILGRAVLGAATSMVAGVGLMQFPGMPPMALYGVGCALGIVGSQYLEVWLKRWMSRQGGARGKRT